VYRPGSVGQWDRQTGVAAVSPHGENEGRRKGKRKWGCGGGRKTDIGALAGEGITAEGRRRAPSCLRGRKALRGSVSGLGGGGLRGGPGSRDVGVGAGEGRPAFPSRYRKGRVGPIRSGEEEGVAFCRRVSGSAFLPSAAPDTLMRDGRRGEWVGHQRSPIKHWQGRCPGKTLDRAGTSG
jgi:hypothetical protein